MPVPTFDAHRNFGISTVAVAPSPPSSGTSLTLTAGDGAAIFTSTPPYNVTVCPASVLPSPTNAEIARVTARSGDVLTLTRAQENSAARAIQVGDLIFMGPTAKTIQDLEGAFTGVARTDVANVFTALQELQPAATFYQRYRDPSQASGARVWNAVAGAGDWFLQPADDAGSGVLSYALRASRGGDVSALRDLYEKQRTAPVGHWIAVAYSAGLFSSNVGTWTVEAGDHVAYSYALVGKTLFVTFQFNATSISGTTPNRLLVALPSGLAPSLSTFAPFAASVDTATTFVTAYAVPNGTNLELRRDPIGSGTWPIGSNHLYLFGTAFFPIG